MNNNLQALDDNLYEILLTSIRELRSERDSELKTLYSTFKNQYSSLINLKQGYLSKITSLTGGVLGYRGRELNNSFFLNAQKTVAKLRAFSDEENKEELKEFLKLQQIYEELVAKLLNLPAPIVLISYTDKNNNTYPLIETDFNNYSDGITNMVFGKIPTSNTVRLTQDFIQSQVKSLQALAKENQIFKENLQNLSSHKNYFTRRIQTYAKQRARDSIISEAFYKHFYNVDYSGVNNFYKENQIIESLKQDKDIHFGGIGGIFVLYHQAQGNDPTFTGQDIITEFVNVQIKNITEKKLTFDLAKKDLIENFYLFVSQIILDTNISDEEAAKASMLFFKQENRDITALEAIEKYGTQEGIDVVKNELKLAKS